MLDIMQEDHDIFALPSFERCVSEDIYLINIPMLKRRSSYNSIQQEKFQRVSSKDLLFENLGFEELPFHIYQEVKEIVKSETEIFIELLQEQPFFNEERIEPFKILCGICLQKTEDFSSLDCLDYFCKSCIRLLLKEYIENYFSYPEDHLCPRCSAKISDAVIKEFTTDELYDKMLKTRAKLNNQKLVAQNKAFYCPIPSCEGLGLIIPREKITACNKCMCSLCNGCRSAVHPGVTCEEAMTISKDSQLEELLLSQNWKKCPTCGVPVEKIDGCQFVTCTSPICKGKNALCYLCGRFLIEDQHYSHFQTKGPFGDICNTIEGIEEEVDPDTLHPILGGEDQVDENLGGE